MRSSGFAFEDLMMGGRSIEDFSDQVFTEMTDLNLGKWACLENSWSGGSEKSPSSGISTPSTAAATKKLKPPSSTPRCKVEGCNLDLSGAKDYHRKHRVCDRHSKSSLVIVQGLERRFCQQCSRFHGLSEFDENKRSCRRRLSAHNARRRKKQQERIEFDPSRLLPSSFYGQQVSHNAGYYPISMHGNHSNGLLAPNGVLTAQGLYNVSSATDIDRALYLLSRDCWGSYEPVSVMSMPQTQPQTTEYWVMDGEASTYPPRIGTDFYFSPLQY